MIQLYYYLNKYIKRHRNSLNCYDNLRSRETAAFPSRKTPKASHISPLRWPADCSSWWLSLKEIWVLSRDNNREGVLLWMQEHAMWAGSQHKLLTTSNQELRGINQALTRAEARLPALHTHWLLEFLEETPRAGTSIIHHRNWKDAL